MVKRFCIAVVFGMVAMAAFAPGAAAAPDRPGELITLTCDGQSFDVVVNGNGDFTPGHLVGSTSVFVLQSIDATFTFTPSDGSPPQTETFARAKHNVHGDLVTCTFDITETAPDGTFHGFGTVIGFITPAS